MKVIKPMTTNTAVSAIQSGLIEAGVPLSFMLADDFSNRMRRRPQSALRVSRVCGRLTVCGAFVDPKPRDQWSLRKWSESTEAGGTFF